MDVTKLVAIEIDSKHQAKEVHRAIDNRADEGKLEIEESTLVYKSDRGHIKTHYYGNTGFGIGASIGGGIGLGAAIGVATLGFAPILLGIGLLPGMFAGGFVGHFFTKHFAGKDFLKDIGAGLDAGKGYVIVATDDAGSDFLAGDSSTSGHNVAHVNVTPEFIQDLDKAHAEAVEASSDDSEEE